MDGQAVNISFEWELNVKTDVGYIFIRHNFINVCMSALQVLLFFLIFVYPCNSTNPKIWYQVCMKKCLCTYVCMYKFRGMRKINPLEEGIKQGEISVSHISEVYVFTLCTFFVEMTTWVYFLFVYNHAWFTSFTTIPWQPAICNSVSNYILFFRRRLSKCKPIFEKFVIPLKIPDEFIDFF